MPPIQKMDASLSMLKECKKLSMSTNAIEKIQAVSGMGASAGGAAEAPGGWRSCRCEWQGALRAVEARAHSSLRGAARRGAASALASASASASARVTAHADKLEILSLGRNQIKKIEVTPSSSLFWRASSGGARGCAAHHSDAEPLCSQHPQGGRHRATRRLRRTRAHPLSGGVLCCRGWTAW